VDVGESDAEYVLSSNRFLDAMVRHRLHETLELVRHLAIHRVLKGEISDPERYESHTSGIASLQVPEVSEATNELDIYRGWWAKHVRWDKAKECLCRRKRVELDQLRFSSGGGFEQIWRAHPMFLSACVQVAYRSLIGDGFTDLEVFTSHGELGSNDPIPADATLWITANHRMETYLTSDDWRIDAAPMEDLTDVVGGAFNVTRQPKESRKDYIIRVKYLLDDRLIRAMYHANGIALHPKVKLRAGPPLDTSNRHEDMLVLRLFGVGNPGRTITRSQIVAIMPDAFLKADGKPVRYPKEAVSERTNHIGKYLGFLAAGGKTP